jgi:general nucleoside transport system permease protein
MLFELEKRKEPSRSMVYLTPLIAVVLTMIVGALVFSILGYDGPGAVWEIFIAPLIDPASWQDLGLKAAPLVMIAVGLAVGFKANVWNIGAEGQYVMGGLAGTGVALATWHLEGWWILPLMCIAGTLGGMAWAAIPAFLKTRLNVNEILSSLMLTYVSIQLLYWLMNGPWKDPEGFNFPQSRLFNDSQILPYFSSFGYLNVPLALIAALIVWFVMTKTVFGFQVRVVGEAPHAARYGGFSRNRTIWMSLMIGGGMAGLAGIFEAAGPFGQMVPQFPTGYGFTAIIVAFLGRLHPLGIVILGGLVLAVTYVGGESAQATLGLPSAATGVFQAMLLFFLLATDILINYRLRLRRTAVEAAE